MLRPAFTNAGVVQPPMASASMSREADAAGGPSGLVGLLSTRPLLTALCMIAVTTVLRSIGRVDADVAWQLWIGRQLNHGAHLYSDIIETNPPLWFWMAMPVDRLSDLFHLRSDHVLILLIGFAAALSVTATDRLLGPISNGRRTLFLAFASLVLVGTSWLEFGQREHITLIGALPYAALLAARRARQPVRPGLAAAIGVGAALGFALKHYFLIVPLLLEVWLIATLGKKWRPARSETAAVAFVGVLYATALLLGARDYLTNIVPMLLLAYGATGAKRLVDLFQPAVITALISIVLLLSNRRFLRSESSGIAATLTVSAIGFTIAYFIQAKGWSYHALPMLGCAAIALAAALCVGVNVSRITTLAAPALLLLPFAIAVQQGLHESEAEKDVVRAVQGMHEADTVGFISPDPSFGWHVIPERGLRFALRYNGFWMMQAVVSNELRGGADPRLTQLGRQVVRETTEDFECTPPRRIIVNRPSPAAARAGEFDILAFFMRDPKFASLLAHYRPVFRSSVEAFELATPLERARNCPRWSPV